MMTNTLLHQALDYNIIWCGNVIPEEKVALIKQLQNQGKRICFVGDGLNDAIAMKQANVSVCLSSASVLTSEVAQIIMQKDSLAPFDSLFDMATHLHKSLGKSMNLWIGFGASNALAVQLIGFGLVQSSLLYSAVFIAGLQLSKSTPNQSGLLHEKFLIFKN